MARPAFAGRRARSRFGQLAAFGAVVLLIAAALAVLGGAIAPLLNTGTRTLVTQAGPTAAATRIQIRLSDDATAQDEKVQAAFSSALRDVPAHIVRTITADTDALIAGAPALVQVNVDPTVADVADLTAGAWPTAADQTAIQDAAAAALALNVGDTVTIGTRTLTISGIWHATDPAAPRWFGDPAVASGREGAAIGPLIVDESVLADVDHTPTVRWTLVLDPAALAVGSLPETAEALARLDAEARRLGEGNDSASLEGSLADTVARATRVAAVAVGVLGLPLVLVTVAGAIVLALIARAIAAGRGAEFVLLRARGASLRALTGAAAREAALAAVIGAALGAATAVLALRFGLPLIGASGELAVPLALVIAGVVAVLAVALSTVVTVAELRVPVTARSEAGRAAVIASLGPLTLALLAAGLALAQFLSLGSPVVVGRDGVVRTDPLALTAPVLVLLAGALAAPAITGPIVAVAERFARIARGILPVLPLRQLARRTRAVAAGVLVVALAAGAMVLAYEFQRGATAARAQAEDAATGADLRVVLPVRSSVGADLPGASSTLLDGVAGVDASFAVLGTTASVGADAVPLIAADTERLPGVTPQLIAARPGLPLPSGATALTVHADLQPEGEIPAGLTVEVLVWLADRDGAALRVPLGVTPLVSGSAEITGDIPADAATILAVEFRPPAMPPSTVVDVHLTDVAAPDGTEVGFDGAASTVLTSSKPERFLPKPSGLDPLPVVIGAQLAERLGLTDGTDFVFRVGGVPAAIRAKVVGIAPVIPGTSGSLALVVNLLVLEGRAVELGGSVPAANQLWVTSADPDAAAVGIRAALTTRSELVTPRTLSPGPVLDPTIFLFAGGVAVTALLAILGFAAVAASIGQRRRVELTPLRSLGMSAGHIRSARAIELIATAALATLLGAAAGLLTAVLVVPGLVGALA